MLGFGPLADRLVERGERTRVVASMSPVGALPPAGLCCAPLARPVRLRFESKPMRLRRSSTAVPRDWLGWMGSLRTAQAEIRNWERVGECAVAVAGSIAAVDVGWGMGSCRGAAEIECSRLALVEKRFVDQAQKHGMYVDADNFVELGVVDSVAGGVVQATFLAVLHVDCFRCDPIFGTAEELMNR